MEKTPAPDFNAAAPPEAFDERMALYKAIEHGDLNTIADTMQKHPDATGWRFFGSPVCVVAAVHNQLDALRLLEAYGADINAAETPSGMTPLMYAASANYKDIATFLMQSGANPALTDKDGWTAERYADKRAEVDSINLVLIKARKIAKPADPSQP